jgi:PhnB protein
MNDNKQTPTSTVIQPYLFFGGRCQEALDFYRAALGAEVDMVMRFEQSPEPVPAGMLAPGFEKKIMHSSFRIGGNTIMASDGCSEEESGFKGFSLALQVATIAEADQAFARLAEGGQVQMALAKTFWSPRYGMLTDRFGIGWMVMVPGEPAP